jgi:sugar phosphate isomerase/epimerase
VKLGLSSYTFGWAVGVPGHAPPQPLDELGLLDKCRDHGVALLQIGDNLPLHTFDESRMVRFAERATTQGVQVEVGARRLIPERVAEYARIARRLNARLMRFVIDDVGFHPGPDEVTAILKECAPVLDGLLLGLENHDRFTAATLRDMIERAGDERIGVCLDTANSLGAGEGLDTVLATLAPLTVHLHIKDFQIARMPHRMGFHVEGRPAGAGMLDVPAILRRLVATGRCATAALELWTPPEADTVSTIAKEAQWASRSLDYLRPFFEQKGGSAP